MTPARYRQVKEVLGEVLELAPDARGARLAALVGDDNELRREVESLLAAAPTDDFLATPPALADDRLGCMIGPWRIEEMLGRGGMGTVYRATRDDDALHREVALKIIKRGMDTEFVVRRFRDERRILAELSHPNIAKLLDADSTTDGVPWFAMELVRGQPIDQYCATLALDLAARLALFRTVCGAVHHAHRNLIVHRDLKPSNILITPGGEPVLLDFGIAKLLDPERDGGATATEQRLMTPAYASPEQLAGGAITTATDVYSLGLLLHELLTEVPTHAHAAADRRPLPSTVARDPRMARRLRGDLDTIIMMALAPEPAQRYASVRELAQDLDDHLAGRPVIARREGALARVWRAVKRHRAVVIASGAIAAALITATVVTTQQARIAREERALAERRFADVRTLAHRLLFELHDAIAELPGSTPARQLLVVEGVRYLDDLSRSAENNAPLLVELASGWLRVGDVQGNDINANLGDRAGARASYERSLRAAERALELSPQSRPARRVLADAHDRLGDALWGQGDLAGSLGECRASIALLRPLVADARAGFDVRDDVRALASGLGDLGDLVADTQDPMPHYQEALALVEGLVQADPDDARATRTLTIMLNKIGARLEPHDRRAALASYRRALALREALAARDPQSAAAQRDVSVSLERVGRVLRSEGDLAGSRDANLRGFEIAERAARADPDNFQAAHDLAVGHIRVAELEDEQGKQTSDAAARRALFVSARARYQQARAMLSDFEARGVLAPRDKTVFAEIAASIAAIDQRLAAP